MKGAAIAMVLTACLFLAPSRGAAEPRAPVSVPWATV